MKLKIAVLSGDGIGPEVCEQGVKGLKAIEKKFKLWMLRVFRYLMKRWIFV
jgi:isocitrate/isopropylmalate dehydrogenase